MEGTERLQRAVSIGEVANVELHDLRAVLLTCIAHRDAELVVAVLSVDLSFANLEGGITETITESEEWIVEVTVGAALHGIVLVVGQLTIVLIEGHREFSARVVIAEEHIGHSCTTFLTRIPSLQNGFAAFGLRCQCYG